MLDASLFFIVLSCTGWTSLGESSTNSQRQSIGTCKLVTPRCYSGVLQVRVGRCQSSAAFCCQSTDVHWFILCNPTPTRRSQANWPDRTNSWWCQKFNFQNTVL